MQKVISNRHNTYPVEELARGPKKSDFKREGAPFPDGLYFMDGHWYSCRDNERKDSYTLKYQRPGTAHFCQTFAAMIFLGEDEHSLKAEQWADNIKQAVQFWIDLINNKPAVRTMILDEIKTSKWAKKGGKFEGTENLLKNATKEQLLSFLEEVKSNAATFVPCTEG